MTRFLPSTFDLRSRKWYKGTARGTLWVAISSFVGMGRPKKKNVAAQPAVDDDALLDAAIAENAAENARKEAAQPEAQAPAAAGATLTMQEALSKLDRVNTFNPVSYTHLTLPTICSV